MLTLATSKQTVAKFAFSADGRHLAVAGTGRKVHLWDLTAAKLKPVVLPAFKDPPEFVGFAPDGKLLALSRMGEYAVHNPESGKTYSAALSSARWVGDVVAPPDLSALYGTGWEAKKWAFNGRLREEWSFDTGGLKPGHGGAVLTPDGLFACGIMINGVETHLHVRDAATGKRQHEQSLSSSLVRNLSLLPDGKTMVCVREKQYQGPAHNAIITGSIGGEFQVVQTPLDGAKMESLALHPSGKWAAVGQDDGLVRIFDTNTWAEVISYQWPVKPVAGIAFAPDGLKAAAGGAGGKFVVWDVDL